MFNLDLCDQVGDIRSQKWDGKLTFFFFSTFKSKTEFTVFAAYVPRPLIEG